MPPSRCALHVGAQLADLIRARPAQCTTRAARCISILHEPGEDKGLQSRGALAAGIGETILLSVISMLSDPNDQSPQT